MGSQPSIMVIPGKLHWPRKNQPRARPHQKNLLLRRYRRKLPKSLPPKSQLLVKSQLPKPQDAVPAMEDALTQKPPVPNSVGAVLRLPIEVGLRKHSTGSSAQKLLLGEDLLLRKSTPTPLQDWTP